MRESTRRGIDYLDAVTVLLQRMRAAHPTKGLYEAAELQWWWSIPRRTDVLEQLFWFGGDDQPVAAAIFADFSDRSSAVYDEVTFCPLLMPDASDAQVAAVVGRGLAVAAEHGFKSVELEVARSDEVMIDVLVGHGFSIKAEGALALGWVAATERASVSALPEGFRLANRADTTPRRHHIEERNPRFVEGRLLETSLYRPDLDLVVLDDEDNYAAYGMFWHDPVTLTGVVEPMRTLDGYQRLGLARHVLTAGLELLAAAGAERMSIGWEPDNPASGHLYRSVGFVPDTETDLYAGPTGAPSG